MIKRKRNQKLENEIQYGVYNVLDVNCELLDNYVLNNPNTGMEVEEEKEHHLKTIMTCGTGEIPTPVIEIDQEYKYPRDFRRGDRLLKYSKDVDNDLIMSRDEICEQAQRKDNVSISEIQTVLEKPFYSLSELKNEERFSGKLDKISSYLERSQIRTKSECNDAYTCFRKRIVKLARKTRKNESNIAEKIKKLWVELNYNKAIYDLHLSRCNLKVEYFEVYDKILSQIKKIKNPKLSKKIEKRFYRKKSVHSSDYYKTCGSFAELAADSTKIRVLKELIFKVDPKLNSVELEKEVKILESLIGCSEKPAS